MKKRTAESEKMSDKAGAAFEEGSKANRISDNYSLYTVIFSMVMFLGAITTKIVRPQLSLIVIVTSTLIFCVAGLLLVFFSLPIAHRG
jgi:hypothetical protein